jgi:hypothetical protein
MAKRPVSEMTPEQREHERAYQREYYRERRKQLSESKRIQREETPGVREAYQERSKKYYAEFVRPGAIAKRVKELAAAKDLSELPPLGEAIVVSSGRRVEFFNLAALGLLLNRSPDTLLDWRARGVLPRPIWTHRELDRALTRGNPWLFSREEMEVYERCRDLMVLAAKKLKGSAFKEQLFVGISALRDSLLGECDTTVQGPATYS